MLSRPLNRRNLASLALGPIAFGLDAATPRSAHSRVIDVATHFYDPSRPQGVPWPSPKEPVLYRPTLPARFRAETRPIRVDGVVVIEASPWLEDNLWLLTLAEKEPLIRAVVGNVPPGHPDFTPALERFARNRLFRGIRIGAGALPAILSDRAKFADIAQLSERSLSLDILVTAPAHYQPIADLAARLPQLRIIVGHLPLDDSTGLDALGPHTRVYAKASGAYRRENQLDHLWKVFGPERILYASNWPVSNLLSPYAAVFRTMQNYLATRPTAETEQIFCQNAAAIYQL